MIRKIAPVTASLTLALTLGACGDGTNDAGDGAVVDPAATDPAVAEPLVVETPDASAALPDETPVTTTAESMAAEVDDGWTAMQDDWQNSAGLVKDRWAELTEEEILDTGGDREQLVGLLQERYGIERDQAEQEVNDWAATL